MNEVKKILVAMDSFKGSVSSIEAGEAVKMGILRAISDAQVTVLPLADGGEGTTEVLTAHGGQLIKTTVTGPLGQPVKGMYGILADGETAVIEMANVSGLPLVPEAFRDPLRTTTRGVGDLIRHAIDRGCRRFVIGIGGSATNDGGIGMLQALGFDFLDEYGRPVANGAEGLSMIRQIKTDHVLPKIAECTFRVACDVSNPLCGPKGCSLVFAPQKGASDEQAIQMDQWMMDYATLTKSVMPDADPEKEGAGAAGGIGFAFMAYLHATLQSGVQLVLEELGFETAVKEADVVVTGEGRLDEQTVMGKAPIGVAGIASRLGKTVLAFAGSIGQEAHTCNEEGITAYFSIQQKPLDLVSAMGKEITCQNLADTAEQVFRLYQKIKNT